MNKLIITGMMLMIMSVCQATNHATNTVDGNCKSTQYKCTYENWVWCCESNPEKQGGCEFLDYGAQGCCGKHDLLLTNCTGADPV